MEFGVKGKQGFLVIILSTKNYGAWTTRQKEFSLLSLTWLYNPHQLNNVFCDGNVHMKTESRFPPYPFPTRQEN